MKFLMIPFISNKDIFSKLTKLEKIMSANQEKIDAIANQLAKAKAEIVAEIEALKNQPGAEVLDFSALEGVAQAIDDLNQDAPVDAPVDAPTTE